MRHPRVDAFAPYIRSLADGMGLKDWTIYLDAQAVKDPETAAAVSCIYGQREAVIELSETFLGANRVAQRYYLVHELVHCFFGHFDNLVARTLKPRALHEPYNLAYEYGVDSVARALAPHMPLPPLGRRAA